MKSTLILLLLSVMALSACQISNISPTGQPSAKISPTPVSDLTEEISQPSATGTSTLVAVPTPSVTTLPPFTSPPTPTTTLTPELEIDWSLFDPDIKPPIEILHSEPLIVKSDELIDLKFNFTCAYKYKTPGANCDLIQLFLSLTPKKTTSQQFFSKEKYLKGGVYWTAVLPATDENGKPFRYYLLVNDPQVGLDVRFPSGGKIGFLAVPAFIPMNLLDQTQAEQGELVLAVPGEAGRKSWGTQARRLPS